MDPQLQGLLDQHKQHLVIEENGKIKCLLNGHTMPPKLEVIQAFVRWVSQC